MVDCFPGIATVLHRELQGRFPDAYDGAVENVPAIESAESTRGQGLLRQLSRPVAGGPVSGYVVAVIAVGVAGLVRGLLGLVLDDLSHTFVIFMAAVIAVAFFVGPGPAVLATLLSLGLGFTFIAGQSEVTAGTAVVGAIFLVESLAVVFLGDRLRNAVARLMEREAENTRLFDQAQANQIEVTEANAALQLLADAGVELNSNLDLDQTLTALAGLIVPRMADACMIDLARDGELRRVATSYAREELGEPLQQLAGSGSLNQEIRLTAAAAIMGGDGLFVREFSDALLSRLADDSDVREAILSIQPKSYILVPMATRGQVLGVISFLRVGDRPFFDDDDYSLALQLGRRAAMAADNARLYADARRANDAKDEFLGLMSHELRTPITVIHGGARVLRSRGEALDAETSAGILADIERESNRLSRMLENLLALSRAELDREVSVEPVLLQRLIPRFVETLDVGRERELSYRSEGDPPAVSGEPSYIEHVVRNLVTNAVKYSPSDAPIEVVLSAHPDGASVTVLDRGFGVGSGEASRIFERFYRSERTAKLASGAGLGLAVCKRLVEAMQGEVWAKPREGGGLEVGFRLPAYNIEGDGYDN